MWYFEANERPSFHSDFKKSAFAINFDNCKSSPSFSDRFFERMGEGTLTKISPDNSSIRLIPAPLDMDNAAPDEIALYQEALAFAAEVSDLPYEPQMATVFFWERRLSVEAGIHIDMFKALLDLIDGFDPENQQFYLALDFAGFSTREKEVAFIAGHPLFVPVGGLGFRVRR